MYLKRICEKRLKNINNNFPVLMICGARQVGKSTLLNHVKDANRKYISFDDLNIRKLAKEDPALFIQSYKGPIIIDEFQYVPEILSFIKLEVDKKAINDEEVNGLYWLTESQQFKMMKNASESLAGRVGIIDLSSLSNEEIEGVDKGLFQPKIEILDERFKNSSKKNIKQIYENIFRGGMPKLIVSNIERDEYYSNYIRTYIERDIHELAQVGNTISFYQFIVYLAARIAQEINYAEISKAIGVSAPTIKTWVSILEASGIIFLLYPYSSNITNRLVKTPKLYFLDTGLCAYLAKWPTAELIQFGSMDGAYLENYVISEIVKSYYNNGKTINFYYYRDFDQKEIDLLFLEGETLFPVEIKKNVYPTHADKNFSVLNKFKLNVAMGIILCMVEEIQPLNRNTMLFPISIL